MTRTSRETSEDQIAEDAFKIAQFLHRSGLLGNSAHILSVLGYIAAEIIVNCYAEREQTRIAKILHEATMQAIEASERGSPCRLH